MPAIRYSKAFKMQCVREVEAGQTCAAVQRKYQIPGTYTVMRWVRQLGSGRYGKIIRVEKAQEVNETSQLRSELRRVKEALADTHMELALEHAYWWWPVRNWTRAWRRLKKSTLAGGAPGGPSRPAVEGDLAV